jgi:cold shock CspA family protein/ribosome-associated translation inhibitor RaiA
MHMPIKITFRGVAPSPAVESFIRDWAAKLDALYDRVQRCDVVVEAPHLHHQHGNQYRVRIALTVPGGQLVVSHDPGPDEAHEDVYVAVRDSFHAARRRLEDHVRRQLRKDVKVTEGPAHARVAFLDVEPGWGYLEDPDGRRIYFHRNSVLGGIETLAVGDEVRFAEEPGDEGPRATSVEKIGAHGRHELPLVERRPEAAAEAKPARSRRDRSAGGPR